MLLVFLLGQPSRRTGHFARRERQPGPKINVAIMTPMEPIAEMASRACWSISDLPLGDQGSCLTCSCIFLPIFYIYSLKQITSRFFMGEVRPDRAPDICRSDTTPLTWWLSIYFRSDPGNDRSRRHDKNILPQDPKVGLGKEYPFDEKHTTAGTRNSPSHAVEPPCHELFDFCMERRRCISLTRRPLAVDRFHLGLRKILPPRISRRDTERTPTRLFHTLYKPQVISSRTEADRA